MTLGSKIIGRWTGRHRRLREEFFACAGEHAQVLGVDTPDGFFLVSSDDMNVGKSLFINRRRGEMKVLGRAMGILQRFGQAERARAGPFVDIGANIGTSIVSALRSNGFTHGVACEPEPRNFRLLRLNLAANGFDDRVRAIQVAVSSRTGTMGLVVAERKSGGHELEAKRTGRGRTAAGNPALRVETVTLNFLVDRSLVADDGSGLIWIDAQGAEGQILAGGRRLLRRGVPVVLEIAPKLIQRHEGAALLTAAAEEHYTHFIDLRSFEAGPNEARPLGSSVRPVDELQGLMVDLAAIRDVLLLRAE